MLQVGGSVALKTQIHREYIKESLKNENYINFKYRIRVIGIKLMAEISDQLTYKGTTVF